MPTIIVEKNARPGDSWRNRYKSLCLHDPVWYDHLPYLPFPDDWPVFAPKDKIGDWLEMYTKVMELNYWGSTVAEKARWDEASDTIELQRDAVVPRSDFARMLSFLGDNVGDHLSAAVDNVLSDGSAHFEQAVYADELTEDSIQKLRSLIAAQWSTLFNNLVPALEALIADDKAAGRPQDQRARIGFYSFTQPMDPSGPAD